MIEPSGRASIPPCRPAVHLLRDRERGMQSCRWVHLHHTAGFPDRSSRRRSPSSFRRDLRCTSTDGPPDQIVFSFRCQAVLILVLLAWVLCVAPEDGVSSITSACVAAPPVVLAEGRPALQASRNPSTHRIGEHTVSFGRNEIRLRRSTG